MVDRRRSSRGWVLRGLLGAPALILILNGAAFSDAAPKPVHVYEGYSSISKSVTVTKRLVFHMNNDHQQENDAQILKGATNNSSVGQQPFVNHSVQYSIETNIQSNLDGDKMPQIPMETITNDLNEMQKMVKDGFKLTTNQQKIITSTTPSVTTSKTFTTTIFNDIVKKPMLTESQSPIDLFFDEPQEFLFSDDNIERSDAATSDGSRYSLVEESNFSDQHSQNIQSESNVKDTDNLFHDLDTNRKENLFTQSAFEPKFTTTSITTSKPIQTTLANVPDPENMVKENPTEQPIYEKNYNEKTPKNDLIDEFNEDIFIESSSVKTTTKFPPTSAEIETTNLDKSNTDEFTDDSISNDGHFTKNPSIKRYHESLNHQPTEGEFIIPKIKNIMNTTFKILNESFNNEDQKSVHDLKLIPDKSELYTDDIVTESVPITEEIDFTTPQILEYSTIPEHLSDQNNSTDVNNEIITLELSTLTPTLLSDTMNLLPFAELVLQNDTKLNVNETELFNSPDLDYTPLGIGQSIEIGGSFPSYADKTTTQFTNPRDNFSPIDYESYLDYPTDDGSIGKIPSLDIASIISEIDFSKIDLAKLDLSSVDLAGVDLGGIDFSKIPSDLNLENIDLSKLPANMDFGSLDLSTLPKNLSIGGINLSNLKLSDVSNIDLSGILSSGLNTGNLDVSNYPSSFDLKEFNFSEQSFNRPNQEKFPPSRLHPSINSNRPHSFLPPNFRFHTNKNPSLGNVPPFLAPPFDFRSQDHTFRPAHHPQFFFVDHFGNGKLVDPRKTVIQQAGSFDPSVINTHQHPRRPDSSAIPIPIPKIHGSRFPDPEINASPFFNSATPNKVLFVPDTQFRRERLPPSFNPIHMSRFDQDKFDLSRLEPNLNSGNIDVSKFDKLHLPSELNLSAINLSEIPTNFSLHGLDLGKLSSKINLGALDLSNINLRDLDISQFLGKLSMQRHNGDGKIIQSGGQRQGFAIQDLDYASLFDYTDDDKMNLSYQAPMRAEVTQDSRQWVTADEADKQLVDELGISHLVKMSQALSFDGSGNIDFLLCTMCKTGVVTGKKLMNELRKTDREIKSLVIYICIQFGLFPKDVCTGMINIVGDEILYVLRNTRRTPSNFCALMLTTQCKDAPLPPWGTDLIPIGSPKPDPIIPPKFGNVKILHISDLHLDSEYAEGSDADCDYPLCCRDWTSTKDDELRNKTKSSIDLIAAKVMADADDPNMDSTVIADSEASSSQDLTAPFKFSPTAGKWGAFGRCDLPLRTIEHMLRAAADMRPDIVYVTGDLPAHDVWEQTRTGVKKSIAITSDQIRTAFPDTPVVMTIGNHEIVPINSFPVPSVYGSGYNPTWLYESLAHVWKGWVPTSSMTSLRKGGYYAVTPRPGLRVLSLNGNYCNSKNWWLLIAHQDPTDQLAWLVDQLSEAETAGEKAHILTHMPPGNSDCEHNWSRQFASIVTRYANIVTGVFAGHQHQDQWQVIYDPANSTRPVGVTYIAPSATTFREHSPSFRMLSVDGVGNDATWAVSDHSTYTANLTLANLPGNSPVYRQRYAAQEAFNMPDLSPGSWHQVVHNMAKDKQMFDNYMRFKHNYWSEPTELETCTESCRQMALCFLVTGDSSNAGPCEHVKRNLQ